MNVDVSYPAALLSDPGRAAMLMALMDSGGLSAGQLAFIGNVAPQTASSHLAKLVQGQLLRVENRGRHRYYCLANIDVAHAVEALLALAARSRNRSGSATAALPRTSDQRLVHARTCYSHLAGQLGVQIADSLLLQRILRRNLPREFAVTQRGREWFAHLGIELDERQMKKPRFARSCLDWTERRHHIAGKLGSLILDKIRELKWIVPLRNTRAVRVTREGQEQLYKLLRINRIGI